MLLRLLLAADHTRSIDGLDELLDLAGVQVATSPPEEDIWERLGREGCDLIVAAEARLGGEAVAAVEQLRALPGGPGVVVLSSDDDPTRRAGFLAAGALAVMNPAAEAADLSAAFETIIERRARHSHQRLMIELNEPENRLSDFATDSPVMREFLALVRRVVGSDSSLLVLGETGAGKEFLARAIHSESPRAGAPFVAVNCSALSESLLESELFGHVEGAFTGARRDRRGYFELAHGGTLFIDEVGELSPQLQVKLLRVVQERRIQPVGSEEEFEVDVRIIAATNRDLAEEIKRGRFRPDLFYRLSVVTLDVPPLRKRREDIPGMVESHVEDFAIRMGRKIDGVRPDALELLSEYGWPGNVRELANVMERAVLLCEGEEITPADLPPEVRGEERPTATLDALTLAEAGDEASIEALLARPFRDAREELLSAFERRYLEALLRRCHGRVQDAARVAGLNPRSLYEKMQQHGLKKEYYKLR